MRPTEVLKNEHRVIELVLDCLDPMAARCEAEGRLDGVSAREAIDFFRTFADRCHHAKEENQLFPLMEARGFDANAGPTAVMRHEHVEGRAYVAAMERAVPGAAAGDAESARFGFRRPAPTPSCSASTSTRKTTASSRWPTRASSRPTWRG